MSDDIKTVREGLVPGFQSRAAALAALGRIEARLTLAADVAHGKSIEADALADALRVARDRYHAATSFFINTVAPEDCPNRGCRDMTDALANRAPKERAS